MVINEQNRDLLAKVNRRNLWDEEPVFCFTSDVDWASEDVLSEFFDIVPFEEIRLTAFVTHESKIIEGLVCQERLRRGIHPNFLAGSSQGTSFEEVAETCVRLAPEAIGFRSHRCFDVTDITHLLANRHGYKYVSNLMTTMSDRIRPILHESRLIHYPIFFEDGSHLYNELGLSFAPFTGYLRSPGIKIISFHPMNIVFNTPDMRFMRKMKDSLTREEFNSIDDAIISRGRNRGCGIRNTVEEIIDLVVGGGHRIMSLDEIYYQTIS